MVRMREEGQQQQEEAAAAARAAAEVEERCRRLTAVAAQVGWVGGCF
jgi:hypothetical protein